MNDEASWFYGIHSLARQIQSSFKKVYIASSQAARADANPQQARI